MINDLHIIVCHISGHGDPLRYSNLQFSVIYSFGQIDQNQWQALANNANVFLQYHFLNALEASQCVSADNGWQPQHILGYEGDELVLAMPGYRKTNSYGEYVFDFAWAEAYQRYGRAYYPKYVAAIPFTPVTGERILIAEHVNKETAFQQLSTFIKEHIASQNMSSCHILFCPESSSHQLKENQFLQRLSVQFQWYNREYSSFAGYLQSFTARRRKSVTKERQKITHQGIQIKRLTGKQISACDMAFFYQCYRQTYLKRSGHEGYLNLFFFNQLLQNLQQNILLVIAYKEDLPLAAALYLYDENCLYGRYWGALEEADGLHFECCYYQGIEFCIEHHLASFNPGTQGEHKILRGFEPTFCYSSHFLSDQSFHLAVADFLAKETVQMKQYHQQASGLLPFKQQLD